MLLSLAVFEADTIPKSASLILLLWVEKNLGWRKCTWQDCRACCHCCCWWDYCMAGADPAPPFLLVLQCWEEKPCRLALSSSPQIQRNLTVGGCVPSKTRDRLARMPKGSKGEATMLWFGRYFSISNGLGVIYPFLQTGQRVSYTAHTLIFSVISVSGKHPYCHRLKEHRQFPQFIRQQQQVMRCSVLHHITGSFPGF